MLNIKTTLLLAGLMAGRVLTAQSQTKSDSLAVRHEIGFGLNIILGPVFNSSSVPLDFMYKWGKENSLFRAGTSFSYANSTSLNRDLENKERYSAISTRVFLGKEWREEITEQWVLNYGADIMLNYYDMAIKNEYTYKESEGTFDLLKNRRGGLGFRPFIGLLFQLNKRFVVGTEASFQAGVEKFHHSTTRYTLVNGQKSNDHPSMENNIDGWNFHFRTQPASNIFVYYRF